MKFDRKQDQFGFAISCMLAESQSYKCDAPELSQRGMPVESNANNELFLLGQLVAQGSQLLNRNPAMDCEEWLSNADEIFEMLISYASDPKTFFESEVQILKRMATSLRQEIGTILSRINHVEKAGEIRKKHAESLRKNLHDTVKVIADIVEMRDPYTAAHQRRTGLLATAIASELKMPQDAINGIALAASIHDLGKVGTPAEILAKPSKLSNIEFQLVQQHSQIGYEIVKDIKFPWPIATMILQHHERMDGRGYPLGLKGDQILLESRILATADVVEAMTTHRPYRAALGIDAAIKEISAGRGTAFDERVVDACIGLFADNRFVL